MGSHPRQAGRRRSAVAASLGAALIASMFATASSGSAFAADVPIGGPGLAQPGIALDAPPGVPALPGITATSFVVADADTGDILAAKNAHAKLAPASTMKTLTALTVIPLLPANLPVVAGRDAPNTDGTKAGIVAGTTYTVDNLFTAMLMMSANDAAVALADANGSLPGTLAQMNTLAAHLQADDTVALTPDGLDAKGQSSSAYDLALIFRAGLSVPQFLYYLSLKTAPFPAPKGQSFQIQTHDRLLTSYPGMLGGKNGYTVAAEASYVGAAKRNGHTIIVSVMRDQPNFWPEVQALLNWGFAVDGHVTPVGELVAPLEPAPVVQAAPSPAPAVEPSVQALTVTAAPTVQAAPAANAEVKASRSHTATDGVGISAVLIWSAVGVGALFFLSASWRFTRRRHVGEIDEAYFDGLSRLSSIDDLASK